MNSRPFDPQSNALTRLRYIPTCRFLRHHINIAPFYEKSSRFACFPSETSVFNDAYTEQRHTGKPSADTIHTSPPAPYRTLSVLTVSFSPAHVTTPNPGCASSRDMRNPNRDHRPPPMAKTGDFRGKMHFFSISA